MVSHRTLVAMGWLSTGPVKDNHGICPPHRRNKKSKTENEFQKSSLHPGLRNNKWGKKPACKSIALLKVCWGQGKHMSAWC